MADENGAGSSAGARRRCRGHTGRPQWIGQMNFDLSRDFKETPYQNYDRNSKGQTGGNGDPAGYTKEQLVKMSSDEHAELVTAELDAILQNLESGHNVRTHPHSKPSDSAVLRECKKRKKSDDLDEDIFMLLDRPRKKAFPLLKSTEQDFCGSAGYRRSSVREQVLPPSEDLYGYFEFNSNENHPQLLEKFRNRAVTVSQLMQDVPEQIHPSLDLPDDDCEPDANGVEPELLRELETRAITIPELIKRVKGIYAGLVTVEKQCIEITEEQARTPTKLSEEKRKTLMALQRTLLKEHHDFYSATHHPVASTELRELASRYAMPARMWRHGIHALLELIRHRCDESPSRMYDMLEIAFGMLNVLERDIPEMHSDWSEIAVNLHSYIDELRRHGIHVPRTQAEFISWSQHTSDFSYEAWIEYVGDLVRYRMAVEEADLRDREVWSNTARVWYDEAASLSSNTGHIRSDPIIEEPPFSGYYVQDWSTEGNQFFQPLPTPPPSEPEWNSGLPQQFGSNDTLWLLMAGWLHLGRRISRNLRAFYKLFVYLPWAAASMR